MSGGGNDLSRKSPGNVRSRALLLTALALVFYFGFIAITVYRSHR